MNAFMVRIGLVGVVLALLGGCSSFNRDFQSLSSVPPPADDIAGAWEGTWTSEASGHTGALRCIMTPLPDDEGTPAGGRRYEARFHATYAKILGFSYTMQLVAETRDDAMHFDGEANLGFLAGGVYETQGSATPTVWQSVYRSKHDHGRFEMHRPLVKEKREE